MVDNKTYYSFSSKSDRLAYWKAARQEYSRWRQTPAAYKLIQYKTTKQQGLCFWCIRPLTERIHVDHIFPLFLGGSNNPLNLCITHPTCNMNKGAAVYTTYKQSCHRRRQFNLILKAKRAQAALSANPSAKLSKKDLKAIKLYGKLLPIG